MRRNFLLVGCSLLLLAFTACGDDVFSGVYEEEGEIAADRDFAYRFVLYQFGDEVGGVVRFYELEGAGDASFNIPTRPYLWETACYFFGPVSRHRDSFGFSIPDGPGGDEYRFLVSTLDSAELDVQVDRVRNDSLVNHAVMTLSQVSTAIDRQCTPSTIDVVVEIPLYSLEEAPDLSLAVVFSGYELLEDGERVITRDGSWSFTLSESEAEGVWEDTLQIPLPDTPPDLGLSDPDDEGAQYALGYLVLYNDGNGDGAFFDNVIGDEVLALSPDRVLLYIAGPPSALAEEVQQVFDDIDDAQSEYGLYSSQRDVRGHNAYIQHLLPLREGIGIRLERIGSDNPRTFPVLLP